MCFLHVFPETVFFFFLAQMLVYYAHYSGSFHLMQYHRHLSLAAYVDLLPSNSSTVFCCLAVWWFIKHFLLVDIWLMVVFSYLLLQTALVNSFVNLLFLQKSNISGIIGLTITCTYILMGFARLHFILYILILSVKQCVQGLPTLFSTL